MVGPDGIHNVGGTPVSPPLLPPRKRGAVSQRERWCEGEREGQGVSERESKSERECMGRPRYSHFERGGGGSERERENAPLLAFLEHVHSVRVVHLGRSTWHAISGRGD